MAPTGFTPLSCPSQRNSDTDRHRALVPTPDRLAAKVYLDEWGDAKGHIRTDLLEGCFGPTSGYADDPGVESLWSIGDVDGGVLLRVLSKRARTVGVNSLSSLSLLTCCHS